LQDDSPTDNPPWKVLAVFGQHPGGYDKDSDPENGDKILHRLPLSKMAFQTAGFFGGSQ
jgi:hypothetical protein